MRITQGDLDWWLDMVPRLEWTYAKTMPDWPHRYIIRDKCALTTEEYERATSVIRTFAEPGKFYNRVGLYLVDEKSNQKWWTLDDHTAADNWCINMAVADQIFGLQDAPHTRTGHFGIYDTLATEYDQRYVSPQCRRENETIRRLIMRHFGAYAPRTLDVGCGTGLLLDLKVTAPAIYTGVDASQAMLNELIRKHPKTTRIIPATIEESIDHFGANEFELVVSLFGSPSYVDPAVVAKLPTLSSDLTVLMHYREGYLPDYWNGNRPDPDHVDSSREAAMALPDAKHFVMNDLVVTVAYA